jgi:Leucine-rich repeat (LRR) protein
LVDAEHLSSLDIAGNRLTKLDLTPLENCEELSELYLYSDHPQENEFSTLNISALFSCTELEDFSVSQDTVLQADKKMQDEDDLPLALTELIEDNRIEWV